MLKIRTVVVTALTNLTFSVALPVLAVFHRGGEWSYVGSTSRNNQRTATANARRTSYAFINTNVGEHVVFDAGW